MVNAYKDAGVDVKKADKLVKHLGISGYGAVIDIDSTLKTLPSYNNPYWHTGCKLVMGTDGVGTKILVAEQLKKFDTIGIDLVAMCVNDIICHGAIPFAFLDYYATGKLVLKKSKEILKGIKKGCELAGCQLMGGETAEMPDVYTKSNFDLAGFAIGLAHVQDERPKNVKAGDIIMGVPSSGPHSNGYSLLRKLYNNKFDLSLLEPTRIYVKDVIPNIKHIKAISHITGGGIHGNFPRVLPEGVSYKLDITLNDWWKDLFKRSKMEINEFESVFNCGWGLLLVADEKDVDNIEIKDAQVIGQIIR